MSTSSPRISIIAALAEADRGIGLHNQLLWHLSDDLKHFKRVTRGHPVIMGRKTYESIASLLGGPLPGRKNIVITRDPAYGASGIQVATSLTQALEYARDVETEEIFVIGGAQIYEQALPHVDRLYLTLIHDTKPADTFFPAYTDTFTREISREEHEEGGVSYTWVTQER